MVLIEPGIPFSSGDASFRILGANDKLCNRCPLYSAQSKPSCSGTHQGLAVVISRDNGRIEQDLVANGAQCLEP